MTKVVVFHAYYGCDTGCCGHVVELDGKQIGGFQFSHPYSKVPSDVQEFIRDLVTETAGAEHVKDIDWSECIVVDD